MRGARSRSGSGRRRGRAGCGEPNRTRLYPVAGRLERCVRVNDLVRAFIYLVLVIDRVQLGEAASAPIGCRSGTPGMKGRTKRPRRRKQRPAWRSVATSLWACSTSSVFVTVGRNRQEKLQIASSSGHRERFATRAAARTAIFEFIQVFYNSAATALRHRLPKPDRFDRRLREEREEATVALATPCPRNRVKTIGGLWCDQVRGRIRRSSLTAVRSKLARCSSIA